MQEILDLEPDQDIFVETLQTLQTIFENNRFAHC